jgi:hypothetical protein
VRSITIDPERAPTQTATSSAAFGPRPEKKCIAPSGTAPRIGRMRPPTMLRNEFGARHKERKVTSCEENMVDAAGIPVKV